MNFRGNQTFSREALLDIIQADDSVFNRVFWLRASSLQTDIEFLRQYYASMGFPNAQITLDFTFRQARADVVFTINEKERFSIQSIDFVGNRFFTSQLLLSFMKTKPNGPFIQKQLNADIENLENFYLNNGFPEAKIVFEFSPGEKKKLQITIKEGGRRLVGNLMLVGGSKSRKD